MLIFTHIVKNKISKRNNMPFKRTKNFLETKKEWSKN